MNAQGILKKIEADARQAASAALADAQKRADALRAKGEEQLAAQRQAMEARAETDGQELESRMLRMAELEEKKARLTVKRQVMDEAFCQAAERLRRLPLAEKRAFFLKELVSAAHGGETVCVGKEERAWFDDHFLSDADAALTAKGTKSALQRGEDVPGCGFELRQDGAALNCTFESLVEGQRMALEGDVARALFQE